MSEIKTKNDEALFPVRPKKFQWSKETPRYWLGENVFETHMMNALSMTLPYVEDFFVQAVREFIDDVEDPGFKKTLKNFIGQEVCHTHAHEEFNEWLQSMGYAVDGCNERLVQIGNARKKRDASAMRCLAASMALEHLTAIVSRDLLKPENPLHNYHPSTRLMWLWHWTEELEHKAVVYNLYQQVGGTYYMRCKQMVIETASAGFHLVQNFIMLLCVDGKLWDAKVWFHGLLYFVGPRKGKLWRNFFSYMSFFVPGFHPDHVDDTETIRKSLELISALEQKRPVLRRVA